METIDMVVDHPYPVFYVPKWCLTFEHNFGPNKNIFLYVNVLSDNTEQQQMIIYQGYIALKVIDTKVPANPNILQNESLLEQDVSISIEDAWIDPAEYQPDVAEFGEGCSLYQEPQFSYLTTDDLKLQPTIYQEDVHEITEIAEPVFLHKKFRKSTSREREERQQTNNFNNQSSDQFNNESLSEQLNCLQEIQSHNGVTDKCRHSDSVCSLTESIAIVENCALKQLLTDFALPKQNKVILFAGDNSQNEQTIYQIKDSSVQCSGKRVGDDTFELPKCDKKKLYQCHECKQNFDNIKAYRKHDTFHKHKPQSDMKYCQTCKRTFKCLEKFKEHMLGHNDPNLECPKCLKVLRTKYTLRVHMLIHNRKLPCPKCTLTYDNESMLERHVSRCHVPKFSCSHCGQAYRSLDALEKHKKTRHNLVLCNMCNAEFNTENEYAKHLQEHSIDNFHSDDDFSIGIKSVDHNLSDLNLDLFDNTTTGSDPAIEEVTDDQYCTLNPQANKKKMPKVCIVCKKKFDRISDMKRHLIEHVIKRSLAKNPINKNGALDIVCDICNVATFSRVDSYKAHLREHAKLTLYKCLLCDKSFSDSSNFSKHKKLHGESRFECDLCKRRFSSKKSIAVHMELHTKASPLPCPGCNKKFHFVSALNKHIKQKHKRATRTACRFCPMTFTSLKDKWDHEWYSHRARSAIVDCLVCDKKFRKYTELKRHCTETHRMMIPLAKYFNCD